MITVKDHQTGQLFNPWDYLGPKRRKLLETGWAGIFRKHLFEKLPIGRIARHFTDDMGRPTKELYAVIGAVILQQLHDLSDQEVTRSLAFNIDWHYALDITDESDSGAYLSERTLRTYRKILMDENLDTLLFETLTDTLIEAFGVDTSKQRLDSTLIRSNMSKLGRIRICATTIQKFLKKLKRMHTELFDSLLTTDVIDRYLAKKADAVFSRVKPSEASRTLLDIGNDLVHLIELFQPYETVCALPEYCLLERVINEQFTVSGAGPDTRVTVKPPKDVSADSLQNPSDPDAGYDGHKGQGYTVQIMETYHEKTADDRTPDLITYVAAAAHEHDANALMPAIEVVFKRDVSPDELLCDTLYGSDDNVQQAESYGVEVVAPLAGSEPEHDFNGFAYDPKTLFITSCPAGHAPDSAKRTRKGNIIARFSGKTCSGCPYLNRCPVKIGKKAAYIRYDEKTLRLARRRLYEQTKAFTDRYRWRAGIEATNSHLKSDIGIGRLRVRGIRSVRFTVYLKALGLNILRCAKVLPSGFSPCGAQIFALLTRFVNRLNALYTVYHIPLSKIRYCRLYAAFIHL